MALRKCIWQVTFLDCLRKKKLCPKCPSRCWCTLVLVLVLVEKVDSFLKPNFLRGGDAILVHHYYSEKTTIRGSQNIPAVKSNVLQSKSLKLNRQSNYPHIYPCLFQWSTPNWFLWSVRFCATLPYWNLVYILQLEGLFRWSFKCLPSTPIPWSCC